MSAVAAERTAPVRPAAAVATSALPRGVDVLTHEAAFAEIAAEYGALFERAALAHQVFQGPAFLAHWADAYSGEAMRPYVVTVRREGCLALVWPLVERRRGGLRILTSMGAPVAQFEDLVCEGGPELGQLLHAAWHAVSRSGPDVLVLRRMRADARFARLAAGPKVVLARAAAPLVDLTTRVDGDGQPGPAYDARDRSAYRRRLRRLGELGRLELGAHRPGPGMEALAGLAVSYKRDWLRRQGLVSPTVEDSRFEAFFRACAADPQGPLRISTIRLDGRAVAIDLSFDCKGTSFGHVIAADPALEKEGLGSVLVHHVFAEARRRGNDRFDMLAPADPYKLRHAGMVTPIEDVAFPFTARGRLYAGTVLKQGYPLAKRLVRTLPQGLARRLAGG